MPPFADKGREAGKATKALQKLQARFLTHPDVSVIDLGFEQVVTDRQKRIVLRIHVKQSAVFDAGLAGYPEVVDGIPVRIIGADYNLEPNA